MSSARNKIICLFDVDGTLTKPRQGISQELEDILHQLKHHAVVGLVGGSDLGKIAEQMVTGASSKDEAIRGLVSKYEYVFSENGLLSYKQGKLLNKESILTYVGEEKLQKIINFCLTYMGNLILPAKRGNFIEFRNGLINVCPVGRSCSQQERDEFGAYDAEHRIREKFVAALREEFGEELGLEFAIGGQISIDVFPTGWDKRYCLQFLEQEQFEKIYFFGDKTFPGGNDYEIFTDPRTIGHSVKNPEDTKDILVRLFFNE